MKNKVLKDVKASKAAKEINTGGSFNPSYTKKQFDMGGEPNRSKETLDLILSRLQFTQKRVNVVY